MKELQAVHDTIAQYCQKVSYNFSKLSQQSAAIAEASSQITTRLKAGKKLLLCGNGGSAADSQHLAAEFVGRYKKERAPLPAIALTTDTSILTAIGNDYSFDDVFSRQVGAYGNKGDILVTLSTSGNSRNVLKAIAVAKEKGLYTLGLSGQDGGQMKSVCDHIIMVPANQTNHIQEMHIAVGHMLCGLSEDALS